MLSKNENLNNKTIVVTGAVGFVDANLVLELLKSYQNIHVIGVDSVTDYYDTSIKDLRLKEIGEAVTKTNSKWTLVKGNIADKALIDNLFNECKPAVVVNLAAQAGV